jgi:mono/diheme cytochrome c family protein
MLGGLPEADYYDFRPGDPERSLSLARMIYRGSDTAMPPIGTHVVDEAGVEAVRAWIESMTEARGYPAPAP